MSPRTSAEVLEPTQRTRMVLRPGAPGAPLQGVPQHSFFILSPSPQKNSLWTLPPASRKSSGQENWALVSVWGLGGPLMSPVENKVFDHTNVWEGGRGRGVNQTDPKADSEREHS